MTELVMRNYWWPGITKDIRKYVDGYDLYYDLSLCIKTKNNIE